MLPITKKKHMVHDFNGIRRIINTYLYIKVPCPCCNQSIETHKIKEADLEFYKRFL